MEQDEIKYKRSNNRMWIGLFLIAGGILLTAQKMGILFFPSWIFTWPVALIGIGFLIGIQHAFRSFWWLIMVFGGVFWLVEQQMPQLHLYNFSTPAWLILIGAYFIFRRNNHRYKKEYKAAWRDKRNYYSAEYSQTENGDFIDSTSVFGGAKKVIVSKNFKGGDITCFMGGAEIDLTQADIRGKAVLDITVVFGGAKITIPSNWDVKIEINAAFGGVEDKRKFQTVAVDTSKVLILDGTAVFGGIEIRNY